jgi:hypothetical protein
MVRRLGGRQDIELGRLFYHLTTPSTRAAHPDLRRLSFLFLTASSHLLVCDRSPTRT